MAHTFKELKEIYADNLRKRELVIELYFKQSKGLSEIARELGISRQRVFQIVDAEKSKKKK